MSRRPDEIEIQQEPGISEPAAGVASIDGAGRRVETSPEGRIRSGRLAGLSMWQAIWVLSWPVLIESSLGSLVGLTDTTLAAGLSQSATDAIGGTAYFMWFVNLVGMALGVGATALIARAMGKGRLAIANAAVGQSAIMGLVAGVLVGVLIALAAPTIADWLSLQGSAHNLAVSYLRITAIAVPAQTFLSIGIACCRGAGDSVRPLVVMALVNVCNIVASIGLSGVDLAVGSLDKTSGEVRRTVLFHNPLGFDMGLDGVAWGTAIGWTVGAILMLGLLVRGSHGVRLRARRLRLHWHTARRLLRIGLPNFLETLGMWIGNFLTILMVGWLKTPGLLGAHIVAIRIEAFSFLPGFAMSLAAATLAGQYLGARSPRLARIAVHRTTAIGAALMGAFGLCFIFFGSRITGLLTQLPVHLELVPQLLIVCGLVQVPFAMSIIYRSALRGAGDTNVVMWITWISTYAIRLPLAWLFCGVEIPLPGGAVIPNPAPLQSWWGIHPLVGFWIGLCAELILRAILFTGYFLSDRWTTAKV